ncbi:MAG: ABC transporter substrate binding protein, partial [Xanthobacteraceae bacterium]
MTQQTVWIPKATPETREVYAAARKVALEIAVLEIRRVEDIGPAFEGRTAQADALYVVADPIFTVNRNQIVALALGARLPTTFNARAYVQGGGLMSYGPDFSDQFRRSAELV